MIFLSFSSLPSSGNGMGIHNKYKKLCKGDWVQEEYDVGYSSISVKTVRTYIPLIIIKARKACLKA